MRSSGLAQLPAIFTHADALALGISDRVLYQMRDKGDIERLARGIYSLPGLEADPDLVEVAVRAPMATICLTSALVHHDLADDIPAGINIALPRSQRPPRTQAPIQWHRFDDGTFEVGREAYQVTEGLAIGIYSPTRSILDAYRLRHLYGVEQAHDALKRWLRQPGNQPRELLSMAKHFPRAEPVLRGTLEILL